MGLINRPVRMAGKCVHCNAPCEPGDGSAWLVWDEASIKKGVYCQLHARAIALHNPRAADVPEEYRSGWKAAATPEPVPERPEVTYDTDALVKQIAKLTADNYLLNEPDLVKQAVENLTPRSLEITIGKAPKVTVDRAHKALPLVIQMVTAGVSPFLVGPAGSGKTTLAEQVAKVLKRKFYMAARVTSEFKLVGFVDAQGHTVRTQFREAYEHGGVFLFDEVDASDPDALTAFNAALANGLGDFPDGMVPRHKDFVAIAAGNTFGRGADRQYVGRNQLDAATLDRFQTLEVDYDEVLEAQLAGDADWTAFVQCARKACELERVRHIISPRASMAGARMLAVGMDRETVKESAVWKGLPDEAKFRVMRRMLEIADVR